MNINVTLEPSQEFKNISIDIKHNNIYIYINTNIYIFRLCIYLNQLSINILLKTIVFI